MLFETLGTVVFVVVYIIDKEKHPLIFSKVKKNKFKIVLSDKNKNIFCNNIKTKFLLLMSF